MGYKIEQFQETTKVNPVFQLPFPYTLAKRIVVISSKYEWVQQNLQDLRQFLLDQKYPSDVIEKGIYNAQLPLQTTPR